MKVLSEIIRGSKDESGMTTTQLGVQYKDIVVGGGVAVKNKSLVTVQYKLTGGKFGAVLDSSKNFNFRAGKGEVIQGWDIGLVDMREGGRRKLIVPPKAGYGSQDIGAGSGAILYFDITVLSVRGG
jgi:FKBP-type peptidyl-prolyl cis-trans isomerase